MPHVYAKKVLVAIVVFAALASTCTGIFYVQNYTGQETRRETLTNQSVVVPPNEYGQIHLQLDKSDANLGLSMRITNGTIREVSVNDELYQAWLNGSYSLNWYEMPNPAQQHNSNDYEESYIVGSGFPSSIHYIFWNPDSPSSKQVTITAYIEHKEAVYNTANLMIGALFTALGATGLGGAGLFFAFKNRDKIKVTRRQVLVLVGLLLMIVLGGFLAVTYSCPVEAQRIVSQGTVTVPANDYYPLPYFVNNDGDYLFQFDVDKGVVQIYHSSGDSPIDRWSNGTEFDVRTHNPPVYNGSSGSIGSSVFTCGNSYTTYYLLSNTDAYSKNVTYDITYHWTYNNYVAMMAGISFAIFGSLAFILTLLKGKLKDFNKALESQE